MCLGKLTGKYKAKQRVLLRSFMAPCLTLPRLSWPFESLRNASIVGVIAVTEIVMGPNGEKTSFPVPSQRCSDGSPSPRYWSRGDYSVTSVYAHKERLLL